MSNQGDFSMFGHDHHEESTLPEPESTVVQDSGAGVTTQPADDTAGSYIDDVPAPATVSPTTTTATDDATDSSAVVDDTTVSGSDPSTAPVETTAPVAPAVGPDSDRLLDIKQQALQQLTPLVGHLEQSPEEKFRTTMMMIQASDNHELIATAYEAAQQITDEKVRAQALLDIVNEINYFTHSGTEA
jgi:hypothetical protein